jgi:fibronectin type 3 domain-containing protein
VAGQSDASYQKVGQVTGSTYKYEDKVQSRTEKYSYALTAVSNTGVESQKSAPVSN